MVVITCIDRTCKIIEKYWHATLWLFKHMKKLSSSANLLLNLAVKTNALINYKSEIIAVGQTW